MRDVKKRVKDRKSAHSLIVIDVKRYGEKSLRATRAWLPTDTASSAISMAKCLRHRSIYSSPGGK
jgi:hypothetical protein